MSNLFKDILESEEFREEYFVAEIQARLANMLDEKGVSRAELARKLGVSRARVTQILSDEAKNFTLTLLFRSFSALEEEPVIISRRELEALTQRLEHQNESSNHSRPSSATELSDGLSGSLRADLLRANVGDIWTDSDRNSRRNESARDWAKMGSNVIPLKERING